MFEIYLLASFRRFLFAAFCLLGFHGPPAQAVVITVAGVDYDITFSNAEVTYESVRGDIASQVPWWGDQALAEQAAADFDTASGGDYGISIANFDSAMFVFADTGPTDLDFHDKVLAIEGFGFVGSLLVSGNDGKTASGAFALATPVAVPVPEIDGNALAKALFILFALGAWLHTRRARVG